MCLVRDGRHIGASDHVYVVKRTTVQRRSHEVSIRVAIDVEAPNVLMKNLYNVYISP